jgi:hypothetical protein
VIAKVAAFQTENKVTIKAIRPVYVPLIAAKRKMVAQGFITPTIAKLNQRNNNNPFSIPDIQTRFNNDCTAAVQSSSSYIDSFNISTFSPNRTL